MIDELCYENVHLIILKLCEKKAKIWLNPRRIGIYLIVLDQSFVYFVYFVFEHLFSLEPEPWTQVNPYAAGG